MRHNIKPEEIRYRDLCSVLSPSVVEEVRDLILSPSTPQPYTILGLEKVNSLPLSDNKRIRRLIHGETLREMSSSQFLRHLQVLWRVLHTSVGFQFLVGCARIRHVSVNEI
ncbi:unnamed protein product [Schistosoma rodhaini]|uniref:Uncharacterized protein n=1 Tax=Schistosoma rodhaini TaxID=6188 RepID=A0AA85F9G6_9TREM|nr:unnamed protein product [Schistosoma rodhaini]